MSNRDGADQMNFLSGRRDAIKCHAKFSRCSSPHIILILPHSAEQIAQTTTTTSREKNWKKQHKVTQMDGEKSGADSVHMAFWLMQTESGHKYPEKYYFIAIQNE